MPILLCKGLSKIKESCKHPQTNEIPEGNTKKKQPDREQKVQQLVDSLKEMRSNNYTPMQHCIWAEMITSGILCSMDDPPNTRMFTHAGSSTPSRKKDNVPVAWAL